ncbi:MAG: isochorismatase family protein [Rhodopseudomonas sp.]|nr:isochorismatase family protein [Rhodopseudomonas sp.]
MALTTLDPKTALIVIDLQNGIVALPVAHPVEPVIEKATTLTAAFRRHKLPVVLVNVAGGAPGRTEQSPRISSFPPDWATLIPQLNQQPTDHLVTKKSWGAFTATGLADILKTQGVTQIVLAGVATSIGVESTARQAFELGFNVTLAVDAMTDLNADAHANSIGRIFPRLGETGTAQQIVDLLNARSA